jgi:hypothetical protein
VSRNDQINRQLRAGRGIQPEPRGPDAGEKGQDGGRERQSTRADAETGPPEVSDLDLVKAIAAHEAGLPLEAGRWVRGETVEEIQADAREFARGVASHRGRQAGGLGGGARGTPPMPPSFESLLRAQLEERRDAIRHRAIDIDQYRRMGGNQGGRDA